MQLRRSYESKAVSSCRLKQAGKHPSRGIVGISARPDFLPIALILSGGSREKKMAGTTGRGKGALQDGPPMAQFHTA